MAVYYYNGAKILAPFTITSNEPMFDMTTVSLKTQRASQGHQRWELSFTTVNEKDTHVDSFLASFQDLDSTSTMEMPQLEGALSRNTANVEEATLSSTAASGSSSFYINSTGNTGLLPKGTFIKFQNHDKIYVITQDVDLSPVSNHLIYIYPNLRSAVPSGQEVYWGASATIKYYRDIDNQTGITFGDGILSDQGTITLIEAV